MKIWLLQQDWFHMAGASLTIFMVILTLLQCYVAITKHSVVRSFIAVSGAILTQVVSNIFLEGVNTMLIGKIAVTTILSLFGIVCFIGTIAEKKVEHKPHLLVGFLGCAGLIIWLWFK